MPLTERSREAEEDPPEPVETGPVPASAAGMAWVSTLADSVVSPRDADDALAPAQLRQWIFSAAADGFDPDEVRRLLEDVAHELETARRLVGGQQLRDERYFDWVGEEVASVLRVSLQSADQTRRAAAREAEQLVANATREAAEAREEATRRLEEAVRTAADEVSRARTEAQRILAQAEEDAGRLRAEAEAEADTLRSEAAAVWEQAGAAVELSAAVQAELERRLAAGEEALRSVAALRSEIGGLLPAGAARPVPPGPAGLAPPPGAGQPDAVQPGAVQPDAVQPDGARAQPDGPQAGPHGAGDGLGVIVTKRAGSTDSPPIEVESSARVGPEPAVRITRRTVRPAVEVVDVPAPGQLEAGR